MSGFDIIIVLAALTIAMLNYKISIIWTKG